MNYNQRFDEHIKDQFLDYTPQVHPRIWENIARERERRKPVGFWFSLLNTRNILILGALLLTAGGGAYILFNNAPAAHKTAAAVDATTQNTPAENKNEAAAVPVETNRENGPSASTTNPSTSLTPSAPVNTSGNTGINNTANNKTAGADNNRLFVAAKNNTPADAEVNDHSFSSPGKTKKYQSAARQKITVKNGLAVAADEEAMEEDEAYALPLLFFAAEKNTSPKATAVLSKHTTTKITDPGCPTIEKNAAGNKTYVEAYAGPDYAFRSMSDTGNSAYLKQRKESTAFSSAFSAGIRYTKVFNNGVSIRTGINYSQINERFTYSEGNIVQVVYIINAAGDTIGSYTTTGSRYKTTHNKFKTLDVPIVLGYELGNGRLHTNINAGVIINAYSWQKGEVLDGNLQPVNITTGKSNSPYQFKTNIGVGFIGSVSVYYKLNEKLHLMAEPYFRYNLTPASKEAITFKQKYNTAGLRLGVRFDLR